jgi:hypothetical protein
MECSGCSGAEVSDENRTENGSQPSATSGYRSSRRGSKALKSAKRAEKQHRVIKGVHRTGRTARNVTILIVQGAAALGFAILVLLLAALLINSAVRWNAKRLAVDDSSVVEQERRTKENILVIGEDGGKAAGFLALRVDREAEQVYGIAIPDAAFIDVPGLGFVRIGEAYASGPELITDSISNFLSVPFRTYIIVPADVYSEAVKEQEVAGIPGASSETNLSPEDLQLLGEELAAISEKNVALVPMPVKPIKLGNQTYFEPQREEIADLLKLWWGVDAAEGEQATRVIIYNGSGEPGIAGEAAQELIRAGFRVVDTQNADSFDYEKTQIIVRRGDASVGEEVRKVLGVGEVSVEPTPADVTDVVIIIGKDYEGSPDSDKKGN